MTHNMIFEPGSLLRGKTVVVTRAQAQLGEAQALFRSEGAVVLDLPALEIGPPANWGPLDDSLAELGSFHWLVFSSVNGVKAVEDRLKRFGQTIALRPRGLKIAVVGRKTARYLENMGAIPDFVPPDFVADSLIEHFPVSGLGLKILLPRVESGGRTLLSEAFNEAGAQVVEVAAYESSCPNQMPKETVDALACSQVDAIAFTSGKTAAHTAQLMNKYFGAKWKVKLEGVKLLSIGPQTSISCQKYFSRVDKEANPYDLDGLMKACIEVFQSK